MVEGRPDVHHSLLASAVPGLWGAHETAHSSVHSSRSSSSAMQQQASTCCCQGMTAAVSLVSASQLMGACTVPRDCSAELQLRMCCTRRPRYTSRSWVMHTSAKPMRLFLRAQLQKEVQAVEVRLHCAIVV